MNATPELLLALERSSRQPGWVLFRGDSCLVEVVAPDEEPSRTPGWLAHMVEGIEAAGVSLSSVDRFLVGLGPGSFSGTRASLAALQGIAMPGRRPVIGLASAAASAHAVLLERAARGLHTPVAVIGDAHRERLWFSAYVLSAGQLMAVSGAKPTHSERDFALTTWEDLPRLLPGDAWVITPDADRIGTRLASIIPAGRLEARVRRTTAAELGRLALADPAAGQVDPLPIYLHPPVAARPS